MPADGIYATGYGIAIYGLALYLTATALRRQTSNSIFTAASLLLIVIARLPSVLFNRELNADESQVISHAITLLQDPVYWRSVDGTTIGPLNNYLLVIPGLLGFTIDYSTSRFMGLLCVIGSLFFFRKTIQILYGEKISRLALLFPLFFLAFTYHSDFLHYSSEQLPLFLLSVALYLLIRVYQMQATVPAHAYLLGLATGMVPFAKLQAVPPALVLALAGTFICYRAFRIQRSYKSLTAILAGGISFPVLVLLFVIFNGLWADFLTFYIEGNAIYAGGNNFTEIPATFLNLLSLSQDYYVYFILFLVLLAVGGIVLPDFKRKSSFILQVSLLYFLASLYAITKSENAFVHYLNLGIYPVAFCLAHFISKRSDRWFQYGAWVLLIWFVANDLQNPNRFQELKTRISARGIHQSPVVEALLPYTRTGDYMVVWGWQCRYYVEAGLAQGTAENHSERSIFDHPLRQQYRDRYMQDLHRNKPVVFIDAVGKNSLWVQDKTSQGYESFPGLAGYITENYVFQGEIDGDRLFIRKDRINKAL